MRTAMTRSAFVLALTGLLGALPAAAADPGITASEVLIGAFLPLQSGLAAGAVQQRDGTSAYFQHVNDQGGVGGRKIRWLVENDSYNPQQAVAVAKKLVERDEIFAFVSTLGTVTNLAVLPYAIQRKVPLIGPVVGTTKLLEPDAREVFGVLPTGQKRGRAIAAHATGALGGKRIAAFYQNDDLGKDVRDGVAEAIKAGGQAIVAEASYEPNDIDMSSQVAKLRAGNPDVVVVAGIPKPVALFMKEAEKQGWKPKMVGPAQLSDPIIVELAGSALEGLDIVFDVALPNMPEAKEANDILAKYAPNTRPGYFAYNGMIGAMLFVEALKRAGPQPTRAALIEQLENLRDFRTGIFPPITYGPGDHAGVDTFGIATWKAGKLEVLKSW
jgi:branched-chain amino acid transport system substrate-binding protein